MSRVVAAVINEMLGQHITPVLKKAGLARAGSTYFLNQEGNWGLIAFQRSARSTSREIVFTVNLGVASARLLAFEGSDASQRPRIEKCHWQERLGFLMPEPRDRWWVLKEQTDVLALGKEILTAIETNGIPAVRRLIRDQDLRNLWLSGASPGLTDIQRLKSLSVLLKALGPDELLKETIQSLEELSQGKPTAGIARYHIDKLMKSEAV